MRQIIVDTETTGLDPGTGHRITEIGCLEMINRRLTGRRFQTYVNPEREIDQRAAEVTGLTREFLRNYPTFSEIAKDFLAFLQLSTISGACEQSGKTERLAVEFIIHNAPFDLAFLNHELNLLGYDLLPLEKHVSVIDTLAIARRLHPGQRNSLDALCRRYNVDNAHREYHGALLDAELLADVYLKMTAGQTTMSLGTETRNEANAATRNDAAEVVGAQKVNRNRGIPLHVILANDEEYRLHTERMAVIQARKNAK